MAWAGFSNLTSNFGDLAGSISKISESVKSFEKNIDSALGLNVSGGVGDAKVALLDGPGEFSGADAPPAGVAFGDQHPQLSTTTQGLEPSGVDAATDGKAANGNLRLPQGTETLSEAIQASADLPGSRNAGLAPAPGASMLDSSDQQSGSIGPNGPSEPGASGLEASLALSADGLPVAAAILHSQHARAASPGGQLHVMQELERVPPAQVLATPESVAENQLIMHSQTSKMQARIGSEVPPQSMVPDSVANAHSAQMHIVVSPTVPSIHKGLLAVPAQVSGSSKGLTAVDDDISSATVSPRSPLGDRGVKESGEATSVEDAGLNMSLRSKEEGKVGTRQNAAEEEISRLRLELSNMERSLQHAAKQAQSKVGDIAELSILNDQLKAEVATLKAREQAEQDVLRDEFQHRLGATERKIYALTKERDMLRREVVRKSDTSTLLREKDDIIKQVMAEGEELSKKQAVQEGSIKKLRAQIRDLEVEKEKLQARIQVQEARVESVSKDKAVSEELLREAVERAQAELAAQKDFFTRALGEAREAQAKAEAAVDSAVRSELERKLGEAAEREETLVRSVKELREGLSRQAEQAASREDMLRRDCEALEQRCQAAEVRHEELLALVPESTQPLLRQIEALHAAAVVKAEAMAGVERALNARLQEAEGSAAASVERERAAVERLAQFMQRAGVVEAQLSCLRAECAKAQRSLEKERQRHAEHRQEYLAAKESVATEEGRSHQLEDDLRQLREAMKRELREERRRREAVEAELESVTSQLHEWQKARLVSRPSSSGGRAEATASDKGLGGERASSTSPRDRGARGRRLSNSSSVGSMDESSILQASLSGADYAHRTIHVEPQLPPRSLTAPGGLSDLEALLRQREGELHLYGKRLHQLESTRDSLAEELVKATTQCDSLRSEAAVLPGLRSELELLRRRHSQALELMGERDEQVEELRMDLLDHKEMYRQQIDLLVNQIERLSRQVGLTPANERGR